jgi:hypothetical protein
MGGTSAADLKDAFDNFYIHLNIFPHVSSAFALRKLLSQLISHMFQRLGRSRRQLKSTLDFNSEWGLSPRGLVIRTRNINISSVAANVAYGENRLYVETRHVFRFTFEQDVLSDSG